MRKVLLALLPVLLGVSGLLVVGPTAASAGGVIYEGSRNAVHMELKDSNGKVVCYAYNTSKSSKPKSTSCEAGRFTELLFDGDWNEISRRTVTVTGHNESFLTLHRSSLNAVHMELKNSNGKVVCSRYNTSASSRPQASGCPLGTYTELLFNADWDQISRRTVHTTMYP